MVGSGGGGGGYLHSLLDLSILSVVATLAPAFSHLSYSISSLQYVLLRLYSNGEMVMVCCISGVNLIQRDSFKEIRGF